LIIAWTAVIALETKGSPPESAELSEEVALWEKLSPAGRLLVNSSAAQKPASSTRLLIYALPNGNTIEQTLGCRMSPGLDWHYDIQHVAAQTRLLRELMPKERLVLACAEAGGLSWPTYRKQPGANARIAELADQWRTRFAGKDARVTLAGHSGGGSFIFGVIEGADEIPAAIDRIAILDANYAYDAALHEDKLVRWLEGDQARRLIVLAYDDREIEFQGKKVVGPTGGTYRATDRMVESLGKHYPLKKTDGDPFIEYEGLDGRIHFYVHKNPQNKILHTALVGDMNGLVHAQTLGTPNEKTWGKFGGPRAYTKFIQAEPFSMKEESEREERERSADNPSSNPSLQRRGIPPRPADAAGGKAFMQRIAKLDRPAREAAILQELSAGNMPNFLRRFKEVPITPSQQPRPSLVGAGAADMHGAIAVMPDYLAVGNDDDFVRIPMTPQTAQALAERFGCVLPTRHMVDAIDAAAEVRLAPQPLTEDRESVAAFLLSNDKIEQQRAGKPLGALTIGAKKDVVLSPKIHERPDRVAIYGWRQLNGQPIQPLTTVHVNWYVDYSHGVRLVGDEMKINGKPAKIADLLRDDKLCALLSDEGPIDPPRYLEK
jgi:hypothetical protein